MIKNLSKADALVRELKERLEFRKNSAAGRFDSIREAKDASGFPMLFLSDAGNEAAGQPVIAIRVKQMDAVSKNIFGDSMLAFTPHLCEVAYELDAAEAEPDRKDLAKVMFELNRFGIKIQVKEIADGTAVSEAAMDAASAAEELDDLWWPLKGC